MANPAARSRWTLRRFVLFSLLSIVYFLTYACVSLLSTFFTVEARKMDVDDTTTGFIFGMYPLMACVAALIYGVFIIPKWGPNFTLMTGIFLNGGAHLIFAFVTLLPHGTTFVVFCFVIRSTMALGGSACENCVISILIGEFQDNVPSLMAALELFAGCAFMVGPIIGGGLYEAGGFKLPFLVMGSILLFSILPIWYFLPTDDITSLKSTTSQRAYRALFIPGVLFPGFLLFVGTSLFSFLDPTLAPFAKEQLGLDATESGLLFFVLSLAYILSTPIVGWVCHKTGAYRTCMTSSFLLNGVGLLFLGPAPFLDSFVPQKKIWLICISLFVCGNAEALFFVPSIPEMQRCSQEKGFARDLSTDSILTGVFTAGVNLGGFLGPILGGSLVDRLGFEWMATIMAFIALSQVVLSLIFWLFVKLSGNITSSHDERRPLLGADGAARTRQLDKFIVNSSSVE